MRRRARSRRVRAGVRPDPRFRCNGKAITELRRGRVNEGAVEGRPFGDHRDLALCQRINGFCVVEADNAGRHVLHQRLTEVEAGLAFLAHQIGLELLVEQRAAEGPQEAHEAVGRLRFAAQRLKREGILVLRGIRELRPIDIHHLVPGCRGLIEAGFLQLAGIVEQKAGIVVEG